MLAATGEPTGKLLATAEFGESNLTVAVRDFERGTDPVISFASPQLVSSLSFSPDRTRLAAGLPRGKVLVWDLDQRRPDRTLDATSDFGAVSVAYSPDGALLAAGLFDGRVVVWSARDGRQIADLPAPGQQPDVSGLSLDTMNLAFSPDSRTLAYSTVSGVVLWDVTGPTVRARLAARRADVMSGALVDRRPGLGFISAGRSDPKLRSRLRGHNRSRNQPGHRVRLVEGHRGLRYRPPRMPRRGNVQPLQARPCQQVKAHAQVLKKTIIVCLPPGQADPEKCTF